MAILFIVSESQWYRVLGNEIKQSHDFGMAKRIITVKMFFGLNVYQFVKWIKGIEGDNVQNEKNGLVTEYYENGEKKEEGFIGMVS